MTRPVIQIALLRDTARMPKRETPGASGLDLYADIPIARNVSNGPQLIPTGIAAVPPEGYELQVRPRSSLTAHGLYAGFGTIDADYRGEICVVMWMTVIGFYSVQPGERIAQLVCAPVLMAEPVETKYTLLPLTERDKQGFGSTGRT